MVHVARPHYYTFSPLVNSPPVSSHSIWELRNRLSNRWQSSPIGIMGYCRARRIRKITTALVQQFTCRFDCICFGYAQFIWEYSIKWVQEVKKYCPDTPYILCGLKKDLRINTKDRRHFVQVDMGEEMARIIGAKTYLESSALTGEGVDDIFEYATRLSLLQGSKLNNGCCTIL